MAEDDKIQANPPAIGDLYQLVYFSTSLLPALELGGERVIRDILEVAQARNRKCSVTGALTYDEFHFAQVLEGPRAVVTAIFEEIQRDRRHMNVVVLEEGRIERRDFANWAMAHVGDRNSLQIISPNLQLRDIVAQQGPTRALALVEMMKFWLQSDALRP